MNALFRNQRFMLDEMSLKRNVFWNMKTYEGFSLFLYAKGIIIKHKPLISEGCI